NVENKKMLESRESFLHYIPGNSMVWIRDASTAGQKLDQLYEKAEETYAQINSAITHCKPHELLLTTQALTRDLKSFPVLEFGSKTYPAEVHFNLNARPQPVFNKNFRLLTDTLAANSAKGLKNHILCGTTQQAERLHAIFEDIGQKV